MKASLIGSAVAVAGVFGVVWWLAQGPREADRDPAPAAPAAAPQATPATESAAAPPPRARVDASKRPVAQDPRLALHMGRPDDALVEYVAGPDGRVILEIDNDPSSQGYRKPLREYVYAGDRLAGVTTYKYLGDQVQLIRAQVSYRPDGSIDQYREDTEYRKPD